MHHQEPNVEKYTTKKQNDEKYDIKIKIAIYKQISTLIIVILKNKKKGTLINAHVGVSDSLFHGIILIRVYEFDSSSLVSIFFDF